MIARGGLDAVPARCDTEAIIRARGCDTAVPFHRGGSKMFAWRGRLGLVSPTQRSKAFHYWYKFVPDGVEIVPSYIGFRRGERDQFTAGLDRAVELAHELRDLGCDLVAVSGTPPFLLGGLDFERRWGQDLAARLGVPVIT